LRKTAAAAAAYSAVSSLGSKMLASGNQGQKTTINGGESQISKCKVSGQRYEAVVPDTLDLAERARLGLNHFTSIISEENDCEMYWGGGFGDNNPPGMNFWTSSLQACQPKCAEAMAMLRIMSGSQQGLERESKMLAMLASHVGEEGIYWVLPSGGKKPWLGPEDMRPNANVHGEGRMLRAMIAWYQYSGSSVWKEKIDRMVDGLDRLMVVHKDDCAYFPTQGWMPEEYFRSCYIRGKGWKDTTEPANEKSGEEGSLFNHQGHIPGCLATWYTLTGHQQALRLSGELVRFLMKPKFWADWPGGEYPGVVGPEHAHWRGHFHGHINTLRAILEYALAANDSRLKQFVRDGYEWTRQADFARIGMVGDGQGCGLGRLLGLAVKLTYAGVGDYWEDIDQYIRNHAAEYQFTPEDIPRINKLGEGKPAIHHDATSTDVGVVAASMGAIGAGPMKKNWGLCCCSHGNMGLFYAWDGALRYADGVARVNLLLNRASPWLDVDSYLPYEGKVVLKNKQAQEIFLRIPLWLEKKRVECSVDGRSVRPDWFGRYVRLRSLKGRKAITLEFPVEERTEKWTKGDKVDYLLKLKANTVVEIKPELLSPGVCPLYAGRGEKYRGNEARRRTVERFATPFVLRW